ncbi:MAG: leucyl aminopeptidase family protein [Planctomycetota bacterium]
MSRLRFATSPSSALKGAETLILIAPRRTWRKSWCGFLDGKAWLATLEKAIRNSGTSPAGTATSTLTGEKVLQRVIAISLPDEVSRHNSPARHEAALKSLKRLGLKKSDHVAVIAALDEPGHQIALANAVGRKFCLYSSKTGAGKSGNLSFAAVDAKGAALRCSKLTQETVHAARWAAELVDTPTAELSAADFVRVTKKALRGIAGVSVSEIRGNKLLENKLGGLHAVGRCAVVEPRLLLLSFKPKAAKRHVGLVGKGVVYDTGGLSLKGKMGMPGMKSDMGGAAAVAGAFRALVASGFSDRLTVAIPLAENAIGPNAFRNDDIIHMHSGHSVEINNTDAEGRLLLGDGCSYLARKIKPDLIIDAATLTGAQLVATGYAHAAVVSNREGLEKKAVSAGLASGDLVHPLPFAPEFYQSEFSSRVADMRNSVANRSNAQASCAAQFIYAQIDDVNIPWLHVDLAGPAFRDGRGTGFGVALLADLASRIQNSDLKS